MNSSAAARFDGLPAPQNGKLTLYVFGPGSRIVVAIGTVRIRFDVITGRPIPAKGARHF